MVVLRLPTKFIIKVSSVTVDFTTSDTVNMALDNLMNNEDDIEKSELNAEIDNSATDQSPGQDAGVLEKSTSDEEAVTVSITSEKSLISADARTLTEQDRVWFRGLINTSNRGLQRFLLGTIFTLVVSIGIFVLMLGEVSNRLSDVDTMLGALTTRAVKLNSVLESFDAYDATLGALVESQELLVAEQKDLSVAITTLIQDGPEATQQAVSLVTSKLLTDFEAFRVQVDSQASGVKGLSQDVTKLGAQFKAFGDKVSSLTALNTSVEALITLEKAQYLSVLERQAKIQASQTGQQLPRVPRDTDMIFFSDKASN